MVTMAEPGTSLGNLRIVKSDTFDYVWPRVEEIINANGAGLLEFYDVHSLRELVLSGRFQLWVITEKRKIPLVLFTSINAFPMKQVLYIHWVGGKKLLRHIQSLVNTLEEFVRVEKLDEISLWTRPGLAQLLCKRYRGVQPYVNVTKNLTYRWSH